MYKHSGDIPVELAFAKYPEIKHPDKMQAINAVGVIYTDDGNARLVRSSDRTFMVHIRR